MYLFNILIYLALNALTSYKLAELWRMVFIAALRGKILDHEPIDRFLMPMTLSLKSADCFKRGTLRMKITNNGR